MHICFFISSQPKSINEDAKDTLELTASQSKQLCIYIGSSIFPELGQRMNTSIL